MSTLNDYGCRRTNHLHREFVNLVEAAIERGDMSIERAAELMIEHGIRRHVVQNVLANMQAARTGRYMDATAK